MPSQSGYGGPIEDDRFRGIQIWNLRRHANPVHGSNILGVVEVAEGEAKRTLGYLQCKDEAEYKFLAGRINGDRKVD